MRQERILFSGSRRLFDRERDRIVIRKISHTVIRRSDRLKTDRLNALVKYVVEIPACRRRSAAEIVITVSAVAVGSLLPARLHPRIVRRQCRPACIVGCVGAVHVAHDKDGQAPGDLLHFIHIELRTLQARLVVRSRGVRFGEVRRKEDELPPRSIVFQMHPHGGAASRIGRIPRCGGVSLR